ncbi:MAG TPA: mycofactocin precursor MftA [Ilumatobacteraceae bacterium]|nr:mycofactocin precursor MftA [Ilumatobacteraceae bacterium]
MENETIDDAELTEPAIEEELLVEEISIDGMCGVY